MSTFLVISFNRIDTTETNHVYVETDSHQQALKEFIEFEFGEGEAADELYDQHMMMFTQVNDSFACVPYDSEEDILIYDISKHMIYPS